MTFPLHRVFSPALIAALALHAAIAFAVNQPSSRPTVSLDPVSFGSGDRVTFKTYPGDSVSRDSRPFKPQYSYQTDNQLYSVFFDPESFTFDPKCGCFTFELVVRTTAESGPAWVVSVRGDPVGRFADVLEDVDVRIQTSPSEVSHGKVKIPIHSADYDEAIEVVKDPDQPLLVVRLSDTHKPGITLHNRLHNFAIHVSDVQLQPRCDQCWTVSPTSGIDVPANSQVTLPLNIQPRLIAALFATAFILKRDSPHDTIDAAFTYSADQGGIPRQLPFQIKVRFNPSFWELTLAVLAGALIGTLLRWWWDPAYSRITKKLVAQSIVLAAVAEFVAVIAASFDSKFVLLGFDMDPRQFVPAFILATMVAGGPVIAKWLGKLATGNTSAPAGDDAGPRRPAKPGGGGAVVPAGGGK